MQLSNQISPALLGNTYNEAEKLCAFMADYRGPKNNKAGKFSTNLNTINNLFDNSTWELLKASNGHRKFKHPVTKIIVEYSAHQDPLDPGAAETVSEQIQLHINQFYYKELGFGRRSKQAVEHKNKKTKPNFKQLSNKIK
jgi:hypothetical protein